MAQALLLAALALAVSSAALLLLRGRAARAHAAEQGAHRVRLEALVGRLEEEAREARRATERAERSRDDIVAMVSHELRTPLNAVLGWARLLRSGRLDEAGAARAAESIERSASAQAQIVDDLLDVARIAKGELRLDVRAVELVPVIEAALAAVRPAADARGIAVAAVLAPAAGHVAGDPGRLQQVVWNLLANAVKFTPPGGRVEVRLEDDEDEVSIRVRDTGEGIPPELQARLFEPFWQADRSSTRPHGGVGLGLAIVRHVVEAHGGTVSAFSEGKGKGTTLTVRLPARTRRRAPAPPRPLRAPVAAEGRERERER